jgi:hypothetical protein
LFLSLPEPRGLTHTALQYDRIIILNVLKSVKRAKSRFYQKDGGEKCLCVERAFLTGDWANSLKIGDRILAVDVDRSTQFVSRMIDKARDKERIKD